MAATSHLLPRNALSMCYATYGGHIWPLRQQVRSSLNLVWSVGHWLTSRCSLYRRTLIVKYTSLGHNCVLTVFSSDFGCQIYRITEATRIHYLVVPYEPDTAFKLCKETYMISRCCVVRPIA